MIGRRGLGALGAAAAASFAAGLLLRREEAAPDPAAQMAFGGLQAVARIELRRGEATVTLTREGTIWRVGERFGHPADPARLRALLLALAETRLLEPRPADPRFGLEDGLTLRLTDTAGTALAEAMLGARRGQDRAYLRVGAQAWLAETRLRAEPDPALWLDRSLADLAAARLRRVLVRRAGEAPLHLERPGEVDAPLVIASPAAPAGVDGVALVETGRLFEGLTAADVRLAAAPGGEALGESRFEFTDNLVVLAWPRREGAVIWVRLRAEGDAEAAALNARWNGWAYALPAWAEKAMIPRLEDLIAG